MPLGFCLGTTFPDPTGTNLLEVAGAISHHLLLIGLNPDYAIKPEVNIFSSQKLTQFAILLLRLSLLKSSEVYGEGPIRWGRIGQ